MQSRKTGATGCRTHCPRGPGGGVPVHHPLCRGRRTPSGPDRRPGSLGREREREREGERASDRCQPRVSPAVDKEREEAGEGRWGRLPPGAGGRPSATGLEARRRGRLTRRAHQTLEGVVEGGRLLLQLRR
jgi:hypothetical protein